MFDNVKISFVKRVTSSKEEKTFDIEVDSELHAFVAKSKEGGAVGISHNSALISLSDLSDDRLRHAKSGQWWIENVQRALANNSATYKEKPDIGIFMDEWKALYDSKSGERGIFNRESAKKNMEKYGRRDSDYDFGVNPCVVGSTKVRTNAGVMTMQELAEMSNATELLVESYNIHTKKVETQPIMFAGLTKENANVIELEIEDTLGTVHKITLTPDHQVYTENRGYVKAADLEETDDLVVLATTKTIKGRVVRKNAKENENVYDIKVLNNHNFFADDVLIHNCGEILLRSSQFCNLSEAVIRATDSEEDIARKIRIAAILGTWQSTLTNYKYLSKKWRENCEEERLLGVSLTGIMDSTLTNGKKKGLEDRLNKWRELAVETNKEWAEKIGISQSAAVTTGKPSGTVSSLVDSASGIHARHSPYYIRTVRADKKDPLAKMMVDMGFPVEDDVTKPEHNYVFSFPVKAPDHAVFRKDMTAIEQLELWLKYKQNWTEHNQSVTITVREEEWMEVGAWVYKHFDDMTGVSFLPFSDFVYKQAPYQDCTKEDYEALLAKMPKNVDWSKLSDYEKSDHTESTQTLACTAGGCDLL